jgi:hypothetical protein
MNSMIQLHCSIHVTLASHVDSGIDFLLVVV